MGSNYSPGGRGNRGRGSGGGRRNDGPKKPEKSNDPMRLGPEFWLVLVFFIIFLLAITIGPLLALKYFGFI